MAFFFMNKTPDCYQNRFCLSLTVPLHHQISCVCVCVCTTLMTFFIWEAYIHYMMPCLDLCVPRKKGTGLHLVWADDVCVHHRAAALAGGWDDLLLQEDFSSRRGSDKREPVRADLTRSHMWPVPQSWATVPGHQQLFSFCLQNNLFPLFLPPPWAEILFPFSFFSCHLFL